MPFVRYWLRILAGLPPANEWGGMSLVTTLPAATSDPSPIVTPGNTVTKDPTSALGPKTIGADAGFGSPSTTTTWPLVSNTLQYQEVPEPSWNTMWSKHVT